MPTSPRRRPAAAPSTGDHPHLRGRPLAEQILATVTRIEQLPVRRGLEYRRLVLTLASLCHGNTRMLGDLLGVSRQAASETVRRARRDTSPVPPATQPSSGTAMRRRGRRPR